MEDKCQYSHSSWVRRNPCKALWDDYCQTRGLCSNIVTGCEAPVYEIAKLVNITSIISRGYDARKERTSIHGVYKPTCIIVRHFWMDDHLCDVVLKSYDGAEHHAHMAVLSAASVFFKNLLGGPFLEAQRVQQKQPVEIAASKEALCALLDYIYDGQPEVPVEVGLELLRLADAFDLPKLAGEIAACIHAHLDCSVALQVLQDPYVLHSLSAASGGKVVEEFEICSQHPYLEKLSASQLTRILTREDLSISREETVMNAILTWNKFSEDGHAFGTLL